MSTERLFDLRPPVLLQELSSQGVPRGLGKREQYREFEFLLARAGESDPLAIRLSEEQRPLEEY